MRKNDISLSQLGPTEVNYQVKNEKKKKHIYSKIMIIFYF